MTLPDLATSNAVLRAAQGDGGRARAERLAADLQGGARGEEAGGTDLARLKKAATQFEALFYNQLLKSMRSTVPENGFWGQGSGSKIYRQLHDQELATRLAGQGGLGIADLIVAQFAPAASGDAVAAPAPAVQPPPQRRGLTLYGGRDASDVVRLRRLATGIGGATADTLGRHERDVMAAARESGLPPGLVLAVAVRESGGDAAAESPRGAQGLMQLMPDTAREVGVADSFDPAENLRGGARYLSRMLRRYGGDLDLALAAYNAGPGAVDRSGRNVPDYPETLRYVAAVKDLAVRLGAETGTNLVTQGANGTQPTPNAR